MSTFKSRMRFAMFRKVFAVIKLHKMDNVAQRKSEASELEN